MSVIRPNNSSIKSVNGKKTNNKVTEANPSTKQTPELLEDFSAHNMRGFRTIPESFVLDGLIKKALNALKKGVYWDRGSIINIEI